MDHLCYFCLVLLCFHARLFVDALWSAAGLTSWLSFVMSNCDVVTFPLVSWVRSGVVLSCIDSSSLPSFLLSYIYEIKHSLHSSEPMASFQAKVRQ